MLARSEEIRVGPYAVDSGQGGRRVHPEPEDPFRGPFELDRHRIIESTAFRRLEGKTQVFAPSHHDHFRTRLTHTIEAAHLARCLAVALRANEQLAEAITLAHDLGHAPFGHAGEAALHEWMRECGGFNHNLHSLRVVEYLEHPFPAFRGLNLTVETLSGLAAHETRYDVPVDCLQAKVEHHGTPCLLPGPDQPYSSAGGEKPDPAQIAVFGAFVEAQIASVADRVAYDHHDLEDAIGAGFVTPGDLAEVALWRRGFDGNAVRVDATSIHAVRRLVLDRMLNAVLSDVIVASRTRLSAVPGTAQAGLRPIRSVLDARRAPGPLVGPSAEMEAGLAELERFLQRHLYRRAEIAEMDAEGRRIVLGLCEAYLAVPGQMPERFARRVQEQGAKRVICDYVAGMTDRFALAEHDRLAGG